jgi:hypothetical protein
MTKIEKNMYQVSLIKIIENMSEFIIGLYYTKLYIVIECPVCNEEGNDIYSTNCGHVICGKCIPKLPSNNKCYMCSQPLVKKNISTTSSVPTVSVSTRRVDIPPLYSDKDDNELGITYRRYKKYSYFITETENPYYMK